MKNGFDSVVFAIDARIAELMTAKNLLLSPPSDVPEESKPEPKRAVARKSRGEALPARILQVFESAAPIALTVDSIVDALNDGTPRPKVANAVSSLQRQHKIEKAGTEGDRNIYALKAQT